ncbi:hypothetical protein Mal4_18990 [Maioricimonas rarisocia]|uniref:Uncharacterized protein n=1 Tax=Maioricimonas rarisocia TaxID=2528026 RepID=A0A517Z551_9PLAN|nr:hypothetical protein [Maioricimonas rarisocia]QDU37584.1 hypothetical protein Mal4_18990 [Maioricimonas rarisocia]
MDRLYRKAGIQFRYPEDWELSEEGGSSELSVTVSDEGTSFWSVTLLRDRPSPEHVLDAAVEAFRDDYAEVDVYPTMTEIAHRPAFARDIEFVYLEMLNSAFLRAFQDEQHTVLVFYQATDTELDEVGPVFEAICASVHCGIDASAPPLLPPGEDEETLQ